MNDPQAVSRAGRERIAIERADTGPADRSPMDTLRRLVWLVFGVLQALLLVRVLLLLLGANEGNQAVDALLGVTDPFVVPFRGMFRVDSVDGAAGSMLDLAALVALVAWTLIEALVLGIIGLAETRPART